MLRKKRESKYRIHPKYSSTGHLLLVGISLSFGFLIMYFILLLGQSGKHLSYLSIPKIAQVYLPEVLQFPSYITSVLGLQTIKPEDIVYFVNKEREKTGAKPLRINFTLMEAARRRADVILKYQNFSHQDPYEGIELATILPKLKYRFSYASENIGMGGMSAEDFVYGFMHSAAHRENLLDPNLSDTGSAVTSGSYGQYYVNIAVQLFSIPAGLEESLGYSYEDYKKYQSALSDIDAKLNPIVWNLNKFMGNKDNTQERYDKLKRQREILATITGTMKDDKPLQNKDITLILEYNKNIN
jgi:uncharacterized protein YkwD